jgi:phage shock protein PspC (stress-responsive transcriptional regulator)
MKQTLTINLNQIIFNIDNDAYEILSDYLKSIEKYFKKETEGEEIINDIEARIAEKFNNILNKRKTVINLADVKSIIKEMGTVEDITNEKDTENKEDTFETSKPVKKLFRNTDKKIIAGVAAGLAEYFGIDISLMRLIFLVLFVPMHGFLLLTYIIMWILVPEAKRSSDKLLMEGQPVTLSNMESKVTEEKEGKKSTNVAYVIFRVITGIIGVSLIIGMIPAIVGTVFGFIQLIVGLPILINSLPELSFLSSLPSWQYILLCISLMWIALVPLIFILKAGITLLRNKSRFTLRGSIALVALWFMFLSIFISLGYVVYSQNQTQINQLIEKADKGEFVDEKMIREQKIEKFNQLKVSGALRVNYKYNPEYKIKIVGLEGNDKIKFDVNNEVLNIQRKNLSFPCFSEVRVEVYGPELQKINLSGASNLTLENIATEKLELDISGASKISGNGFANDFALKTSGASSIRLFNLETDNAKISTSGASSVDITVNKTLDINSSGASKIRYQGNPVIKQSLSGASKIEQISK